MDKPYYPYEAIGSIDILARTLGISPRMLISISTRIDDSYSEFQLEAHPQTNKIRTVFDAKFELKNYKKELILVFLKK